MNFFSSIALFALMASISAAVKIDCDNPDQVNEDNIHHCCKHPEGHDDIMDVCSKQTGFKLPNPKEEAMVDLTADRAIAGTCFGKCVFDKLKLMKGDQLDMDAVKKHYTAAHPKDPEYVKEMVNAFDHCHSKTEENTAKFLSSPMFKELSQQFCEPKPSVIWACVIRTFFHNCPADRWSKTDECKTALAYSKSCKDALTSM